MRITDARPMTHKRGTRAGERGQLGAASTRLGHPGRSRTTPTRAREDGTELARPHRKAVAEDERASKQIRDRRNPAATQGLRDTAQEDRRMAACI